MRFQRLYKTAAAMLGANLDIAVMAGAALILFVLPAAAAAQDRPSPQFGLDPGQVAVMEIGADYAYFHANAPPAQCGCFSLQGVGGGFAINAVHGISLVVDLATADAKNVDGTAQNIRILNFLGGPRYSYRTHRRFTPYVQALAGRSLELSNYAIEQNQSGFAVSGGGGVNHSFGKYLGWKIAEADYVYSQIPNGSNNHQNDLRISTGIFLRLGPR